MTFRFIRVSVLLLCGIFAAATFAQNSNSTISGTVQDAGGAVVPGAAISLTNVGTAQQLSTTAKGDGFYTFTNLSPANYKISVTAPGFAEWVGLVTLRVSQAAEVNASLTAASVSTRVTVRDVTPVIDRVNPTLSDVKNATTIETLPVQNRSILNVLAFSPGVVAGLYGGSGGGYTRVIKLGKRTGDNAELAMIELVDYNEIYGKGKGETEDVVKKTRRAGSRKKAAGSKIVDAAEEKLPVEDSAKDAPEEDPAQSQLKA